MALQFSENPVPISGSFRVRYVRRDGWVQYCILPSDRMTNRSIIEERFPDGTQWVRTFQLERSSEGEVDFVYRECDLEMTIRGSLDPD